MKLEDYNIRFRDPLYWLEHANRHYYSSQILYKHLEPIMNSESDLTDEITQHFLALWGSYFLLMSLAFENILKGLIISKEPDIDNTDNYEKKYKFSYKHNLLIMLEENFRGLTSGEITLIKRLQTYLNWMSKYPVPLKSKIFENSERELHFSDNECLITIYKEIEMNLRENCDRDPIRYWKGIGLMK
jgi:hypothetical protein